MVEAVPEGRCLIPVRSWSGSSLVLMWERRYLSIVAYKGGW